MTIKTGRILLTAVAIEVAAIAVLIALVVAFGPSDVEEAEIYAERMGTFVGPVAGFILCLAGGWLVGKGLGPDALVNGLLLGLAVALIDAAILAAGGTGFKLIFLFSNLGKILAGALGGWLAARSRPAPD